MIVRILSDVAESEKSEHIPSAETSPFAVGRKFGHRARRIETIVQTRETKDLSTRRPRFTATMLNNEGKGILRVIAHRGINELASNKNYCDSTFSITPPNDSINTFVQFSP